MKTLKVERKTEDIIRENKERFFLYDFCLGDVVVVDREKSNLIFLKSNLWGQIFSLEGDFQEINITKIDGRQKNGLIRRSKKGYLNYLKDRRVIDSYIYYNLMDKEEREKMEEVPLKDSHSFIGASESLEEILKQATVYTLGEKGTLEKERQESWLEKTIEELIPSFKKNYASL